MLNRFYKYAQLIIDNIEGGYYNPSRHSSNNMGSSGETMYGIDRINGGSDVTESEAGRRFWSIIDANAKTWPYNYKGGAQADELRKLAANMMFSRYERYSNSYLTAAARKAISKSPKLEINFYYACWNGAGRFKTFANEFNNAVAAGQTTAQLEQTALNSRLNSSVSLLRTGGAILRDKIYPQLSNGGGWLLWLLAAGVSIYFITKKS